MERSIYIYGHGDTSEEGFPTEARFVRWIEDEVMTKYEGRYRYTQAKDADVIVLSRQGRAYGHFEIDEKTEVTPEDLRIYSKAKCVYQVRSRVAYRTPVPLMAMSIRVVSFGTPISEDQFRKILENVSKPENRCKSVHLGCQNGVLKQSLEHANQS